MQIQNYTLHMIVTGIVLLGATAWIPYAIFTNINFYLRIVCMIIGLLGCLMLLNRNMYLPFLAECAIPTILLEPSPNKTHINPEDVLIQLNNLPPNTKVVWWAAENGDPRQRNNHVHWKEAYGDYTNSGVVLSNGNGVATIQMRCPQQYFVQRLFFKHVIKKHIHYRYMLTNGMLSRVHTQTLNCH